MKAGSNITTRVPEADRGPGGNSESARGNLRPGLEKPLRRRRHGGPWKPASRPGGTTAQAQTRWPRETCVPARRNHCAGADTVAPGNLCPGLEKPLHRRRHGARPSARAQQRRVLHGASSRALTWHAPTTSWSECQGDRLQLADTSPKSSKFRPEMIVSRDGKFPVSPPSQKRGLLI